MSTYLADKELLEPELHEACEQPRERVELSRRTFVSLLGAGLLISTTHGVAAAQRRSSRGRARRTVAARLHIGADGTITVMTGKVEVGQGSRAQLTQAAAEELRVRVAQIRLVMGDTDLVPDDGITAGSRTTPSTVPAVRRGAATARELLIDMMCDRWRVKRSAVAVRDGVIIHQASNRSSTYAELATLKDVAKALESAIPNDVEVTPVSEWEVLGTSVPKPNLRDIVTGAHRYPSDVVRPNMLYGKVFRPPSYGATLVSVDLSEAKAMEGMIVVRDKEFVGCVAPTLFRAEKAVKTIAKTAKWDTVPQPSSREVFSYLKEHAQPPGRSDRRRAGSGARGSVEKGLANASKVLRQVYKVAYVQHAPMEPRAAVAEWSNGKLTVWTGSQNPFGVHGELARAFRIPAERVRVIVPDTGGGFGGKHSGETAVEAARLAKASGRPVSLRWSRQEEFTWAYFRPAALIEVQAGLDANGSLAAWEFTNINSGGAALVSPYEIANTKHQFLRSDSPLRQGSYRCLAATANNFARESFMDELAVAAGADPLEFRLAHIGNDRLRAVLETAAKEFSWSRRKAETGPSIGVGLACGTEKGSHVAACVEVEVDRDNDKIVVRHVCQAFECGAIQNPANLRSQVEGCIIMGMGAALTEEMVFKNGKILNASFGSYKVPRFKDVPKFDIHLLDRPDIPSAGAGETPIIVIAPAIANAVFDAAGVRIRSMPILPALNQA